MGLPNLVNDILTNMQEIDPQNIMTYILSSIPLEQAAAAHVTNAEAEKLQLVEAHMQAELAGEVPTSFGFTGPITANDLILILSGAAAAAAGIGGATESLGEKLEVLLNLIND
jgi:hypothetical protein